MIVLIAAAALVVIGLAVALCLGGLSRMSVQPSDAVSTAGGHELPDGDVHARDLDDLRFDVVLRGYRMEQVDTALDRLRRRIAQLEDAGGHTARPVGFPFGSVRADTAQPTDPYGAPEADWPHRRLDDQDMR